MNREITSKIIQVLKSKEMYKNIEIDIISNEEMLLYLDTFIIQVYVRDNRIVSTGARKMIDKFYNDMIYQNNCYDSYYNHKYNHHIYSSYHHHHSHNTCNSIGYGGCGERGIHHHNHCYDGCNSHYFPTPKKAMYLRCSIATYKAMILDDLQIIDTIIQLEKDLNNL